MTKSSPLFNKLIRTGEISCEMILKLFADQFDFHRMSCEYFIKNIQSIDILDQEQTLSILSNHCKKLIHQNKDITNQSVKLTQCNKVMESHVIALGKAKHISPMFTMLVNRTQRTSRYYNYGYSIGCVTCRVAGGSSFVFGNNTQMDQWVLHIATKSKLTKGINEFCITLESSSKMDQTASSYGVGIASHNFNTYSNPSVRGLSIHNEKDVCMYNGTDGKIYMTGGCDNTVECTDTGKWGIGDTIKVVVDCEKWNVIFFKNGDLACQKVLKIQPSGAYYPVLQGYRKIV